MILGNFAIYYNLAIVCNAIDHRLIATVFLFISYLKNLDLCQNKIEAEKHAYVKNKHILKGSCHRYLWELLKPV